MNVTDVAADLAAEQDALDTVVSALEPAGWDTPTASARWSVTDQIGHLTYFDGTAALAIEDPEAFRAHVGALLAHLADDDPEAADRATLDEFRALDPDTRLQTWRAQRRALATAAASLAEDARIPWYGPSMGAKSFLTARLMECWAHGIDVRDAVGAPPEASDRLRHIAQLGVITRGWSYRNRGLEPPEVEVRVELAAPSGGSWTWGPEDAAESVVGPALDFCLVVTQRRHLDDTDLVVTGDAARDWMLKAQAFAGPPTEGPRPTTSPQEA
jgi:uncharacterized protein (TIGR03084 family)